MGNPRSMGRMAFGNLRSILDLIAHLFQKFRKDEESQGMMVHDMHGASIGLMEGVI